LKADSKRQPDYEALTCGLRRLAFLPSTTDHDELVPASCYYDRRNPVFRAMLPEKDFPPPPFSDGTEENWTDFLRTCGLVCAVTQEMFLQYANDVQQRASHGIDGEILKQSEVLLEHFVEREDLDETFLTSVKRIRFIFPHPVSASRRQLHSSGRTAAEAAGPLVCFEECALSQHEALVWTTQQLLPPLISEFNFPAERRNKFKEIMRLLGVDVIPQAALVVQHTRELCLSLYAEGKQFFVSTAKSERIARSVAKDLRLSEELHIRRRSDCNVK
jgi:hypothetical protein